MSDIVSLVLQHPHLVPGRADLKEITMRCNL
jgi:hypothetical protein